MCEGLVVAAGDGEHAQDFEVQPHDGDDDTERERFEEMLYAGEWIERAVPASQTFSPMGISKGTYPVFRNPYLQLPNKASTIRAGQTLPDGVLYILQMIGMAGRGTLRPDIVVTTKKVWDNLYRIFTSIPGLIQNVSDMKDLEYGYASFRAFGVDFGHDDLPSQHRRIRHRVRNHVCLAGLQCPD